MKLHNIKYPLLLFMILAVFFIVVTKRNTGMVAGDSIAECSGLVSQWNFDSGDGTDSAGTNNANVVGATTISGLIGESMYFNSNSNYLLIDDDPTLRPRAAITIEAWIKPDVVNLVSRHALNKALSYNLYATTAWGDGHSQFTIYYNGGTAIAATSDVPLNPQVWNHIVGIYDQTIGVISIYVNGSTCGTCSQPVPGSPQMDINISDLYMGRASWSSGTVEGAMDEVRVWNRALTSSEISAIYSQGVGGTSYCPETISDPTPSCPASCNDSNACTTDTCSSTTNYQCLNTPITPCCGNNDCETGESSASCSSDCPLSSSSAEYNVKKDGTGDFTTIQACANAVSPGETCIVHAGTYNERVTVNRPSGTSGNKIIFIAEPRRSVEMYGFDVSTEFVRMEGFNIGYSGSQERGVLVQASNLEIIDNYFHDLRHAAVGVTWDLPMQYQNIYIAANEVYNSQYGFMLVGSNWILENNEVRRLRDYDGLDGQDSDYSRFFGTGHIIRNNYFHGTIAEEVTVVTPNKSGTGSACSSHDECPHWCISEVCRDGAHVDGFQNWRNAGYNIETHNILIENNIIEDFHQCLLTQDQLESVNSLPSTKITDITFRGNTCIEGFAGGAIGILTSSSDDIKIYNNTFVDLRAVMTINNGTRATVKNNIVYSSGGYFIQSANNVIIESGYNLLSPGVLVGQSPLTTSDIVGTDPKFVNYAGKDFSLRSDSPAINSGVSIAGVTIDQAGTSRPQGGTLDIGAYEYIEEVPIVVCTPSWSCGGWSVCSPSGQQVRTCTDEKACAIITDKPEEVQSCSYVFVENDCTPNWSCGGWSVCSPSGQQIRTCIDTNNCGNGSGKPGENQSCVYIPPIQEGDDDGETTPVSTNYGTYFRDRLVKLSYDSAVYGIKGNQRHLFSNEATYWSWHLGNWAGQSVETISQTEFDNLNVGNNVTARPGANLITFENSAKIYAVLPGSRVCQAVALYGLDWPSRRIYIQNAFESDYIKDSFCKIDTNSKYPDGTIIQYNNSTEIYYIEGGYKRLVTPDIFEENKFKDEFILRNVSANIMYNTTWPLEAF